MYDAIIVGAGPAGMTSALYLLRAGKKVLVLEKNIYGGQIVNTNLIENYPGIPNISGFDFSMNLYNQIKSLGVEFKNEEVIKIDDDKTVTTKSNVYKCKNIIIATGVEHKNLNIGEDKYIGKGVSYCATCDGNFYKNKDVAVIGGGNTALTDALYLSNICNKVYLIVRKDVFKGEDKYVKEIDNKKNIEILFNSNVIKINGNELVESIDVDTLGNTKTIEVSGIFIAIGQVPSITFESNIKLDNGYIVSDNNGHTNIPNIYVAGDIRVKNLRQLTTAVSDGSIAATTCLEEE